MANPQDFHHDKSFNLKKLSIISPSGNNIDITNLMVELNIFEDIYNSTLSGEVTVSDSLDLIARLPISGFEYITLVFGKPNTDTEATKTFRIYKIDDVTINHSNQSNQTYTIRFCSE